MINNKINKMNCRTKGPGGGCPCPEQVGSRHSDETDEAVGSFIGAVSSQAAALAWARAQRPQEAQEAGEGRKRGRIRRLWARPHRIAVPAVVQRSGERSVVIAALAARVACAILPALCH